MSSVPERSEIDEEYKWDLESIYADDEEWETAFEDVESRVDDIREYEGRVTEDAETLLAALELEETVMRDVAKVASYARLRSSEDTRNQEYQALSTRAQSLASKAQSAASFIEPEIQQNLDESDVETFVDEEPGLTEYEHYFADVLRGAGRFTLVHP